ncbi:hypothetical protein DL770_004431 [Monosporascus sp. CRB-9-2]|nr:hypothetical protein DL770_004431 [Monosporascus sp. CRB-9-2]
MKGGTVTAYTKCITAISEHNTGGRIVEAEQLFNEHLRNGVEGLQQALKEIRDTYSRPIFCAADMSDHWDDNCDAGEEDSENPILIHMRAADALDRETEFLQPNAELDGMISIRRSKSLPVRPSAGNTLESTRYHAVRFPGESQLLSAQEDPYKAKQQVSTPNGERLELIDESCSDCTWRDRFASAYFNDDPLSPWSTSSGSGAATPAVLGEACLVDIHQYKSLCSSHQRTKSISGLHATKDQNQDDILLRSASCSDLAESDLESQVRATSQENRVLRPIPLGGIPYATFNSRKRMVRRGAPSPLLLTRSNARPLIYANGFPCLWNGYANQGTDTAEHYIDRGTDPMEPESPGDLDASPGPAVNPPFRTVLPMVEDMVLYIKNEQADSLLEHVLQGFKERTYPVSTPHVPPDPGEEVYSEISSSSTNRLFSPSLGTSQHVAYEKAGTAFHLPHEDKYDPFASHRDYLQPYTILHAKQNTLTPISPIRPPEPPTPAQTPPPQQIAQPQNKRFYNLHITDCQTAVDTQDALRSLLGTYFVSEGAGHQQATFPFPVGLGDIWQPVFKKTGPDSSGIHKRSVDLILAIGAQEGVDDEFVRGLSGSLEKLGTKPDGITRSGRLNLIYLVVNAMRTLSTQPSSDRALDSPFTDPCLLAALVIPFLETYMALHSKTQFLLLEYPPEHLSTVLAMQQLIGGDLLKVAGILDDSAGELRPGPSGVEAEKRQAAAPAPGARLLDSGTPPRTTPSFSKADFLLTSSATESEIAALISAVWKILVDRSPSYIPDGASWTSATARDSPQNPGGDSENGPLIESGIRYKPLESAAVMMGFQRPPSPSASHGGGRPEPPASPPRPHVSRAPSPAKSSRSSIVGTIKKSSRGAKPRSVLGRELDVDAVARPDPASSSCGPFEDDQDDDDEDGRFAAEERKYLPLSMRRRETRRGNSRKALKFLGLSTEG